MRHQLDSYCNEQRFILEPLAQPLTEAFHVFALEATRARNLGQRKPTQGEVGN
jgi:hypothetical protein